MSPSGFPATAEIPRGNKIPLFDPAGPPFMLSILNCMCRGSKEGKCSYVVQIVKPSVGNLGFMILGWINRTDLNCAVQG